MKIKDFFSTMKAQARINAPEFDEWLKTATDADIPDAVVKSIEDNFMTMERAAAHKDIHGKIKRDVLDPVDNDIQEFFEQLKEYADPGLEQLLKTESNTYNKLKAIKKLVPEALKKAKTSPSTDDETKKKLAQLQKDLQDEAAARDKMSKEFDTERKTINTGWEVKLHDYRLQSELEKLTNKYTLAEAFEETRPDITEVTLSKIKGSNYLKLGEKDGRPFIFVNDEHGKPRFNGNNMITVDSLLDEAYKPFLKKSETEETRRENTKITSKSTENKPVRTGARTTVV